MQFKYFGTETRKTNLKCFNVWLNLLFVEKVLPKQVYPRDHSFVIYINNSINHKTIFKDLPKMEK